MPFGNQNPGMILPPQVIERFAITSAQDYVLPSSGIRTGMVYWVINRPALSPSIVTPALTIKSSDGDTIDTLYNGRCVLMALQDNPTDNSHWEVVDNVSEGFVTVTLGAVGGTAPVGVTYNSNYGRHWRHNGMVTQHIEMSWTAVTTPGTGTATIVGQAYPSHSQSTHLGPVSLQLIDWTATNRTWPVLYAANSDTVLRIQLSGDAQTNVFLDTADYSGGAFTKRIIGSVTYRKA